MKHKLEKEVDVTYKNFRLTTKEVAIDEKHYDLLPTHVMLLKYFIKKHGTPISRKELSLNVWENKNTAYITIVAAIGELKKRLFLNKYIFNVFIESYSSTKSPDSKNKELSKYVFFISDIEGFNYISSKIYDTLKEKKELIITEIPKIFETQGIKVSLSKIGENINTICDIKSDEVTRNSYRLTLKNPAQNKSVL